MHFIKYNFTIVIIDNVKHYIIQYSLYYTRIINIHIKIKNLVSFQIVFLNNFHMLAIHLTFYSVGKYN